MRVREVASRLPFVGEQYVSKRLAKMQADGLVTRDDHRGAPYRLSALGETLSPIFHALSDWSHAYLPLGHVAEAERVEDALRRLHHRHSTAVIQILDAGGPMRYAHIAEEAGLSNSLGGQQLSRLQTAGLIARTGPRHGDPYTLTDGGRALGAVYATVEHWSEPRRNAQLLVGSCPRRGGHADRHKCPAGGGRRPDRSGSAPECRCVERPVQPRAAAAGASSCHHPVGPGPGAVIRGVVLRASAVSTATAPACASPFVPPRTRARPLLRARSLDHERPATQRQLSAPRGTGQPDVPGRLQRGRRRRLRPCRSLAAPLP
ncbi:winged helix-turn-helix transcriptional regulator [Streptomyces anulatus]|uniref:winged helix-turn-helix transcriptional regulator n=1 Tax=Streptomyces anulatus TaxID=1892 RepID=UPI0020B8CE77|nr:winged helix-turn-helix transcriptional regulator [Streptomyces anulatus]